MKTCNGQKPNPKSLWQRGMPADNSNLVAPSNKAPFSAKRDPKKGKKNG